MDPNIVKDLICVQGNCEEEPRDELYASMGLTGAPLLPFRNRQCLVVTDQRVLDTSRGSDGTDAGVPLAISRLWLDGLYLRYRRSERAADGCEALWQCAQRIRNVSVLCRISVVHC